MSDLQGLVRALAALESGCLPVPYRSREEAIAGLESALAGTAWGGATNREVARVALVRLARLRGAGPGRAAPSAPLPTGAFHPVPANPR